MAPFTHLIFLTVAFGGLTQVLAKPVSTEEALVGRDDGPSAPDVCRTINCATGNSNPPTEDFHLCCSEGHTTAPDPNSSSGSTTGDTNSGDSSDSGSTAGEAHNTNGLLQTTGHLSDTAAAGSLGNGSDGPPPTDLTLTVDPSLAEPAGVGAKLNNAQLVNVGSQDSSKGITGINVALAGLPEGLTPSESSQALPSGPNSGELLASSSSGGNPGNGSDGPGNTNGSSTSRPSNGDQGNAPGGANSGPGSADGSSTSGANGRNQGNGGSQGNGSGAAAAGAGNTGDSSNPPSNGTGSSDTGSDTGNQAQGSNANGSGSGTGFGQQGLNAIGWQVDIDDPDRPNFPPLEAAGLLRPADDIFEEAIANLTQSTSEESRAAPAVSAEDLTRFVELECTKRAMSRVCEVKEISEELTVYRYSQVKTIEFLRQKVATVLSSEEFEQNRTIIRGLAKNGLMEDGNEKLLEEGRLQASCDLVSQYISPELKAALLATYELSALDKHVKAIQETALASAAIDVNGGSDKGKKGTKAAEDKKRKSVKGSTGVEKLKKANTKGMSKISSFFAKS
ncbi:hypothetical protein EYR40_006570 [Pleurotus pulmonarius]|nr:hypothetical protein EYR36_011191 [Pleurotus pulmonarius]KAF4599476.1 hypothetical protein EYR40_006570 [Pleurotus pulmonarius]